MEARAEQVPPSFDKTRAAKAIEWILAVIVQGFAVAAVVGALLLSLVKPQIETWIDLKVEAERNARSAYDSMIEKWRVDHERWSAAQSTKLESSLLLEREMRLRQDSEILRLRDRVENGRPSGRGGAP